MVQLMQLATRQLIQLARESRYGVDPGGGVAFPANLAVGELPASGEVDTVRVAAGSRGVGYGTSRSVGPRVQVPALTTLLYEEDDDSLLAWTWLAEASGLAYQQGLSTATRRVWRASAGRAASTTLRWFLDGEKRVVPGLRGALTLTAAVGQPVAIAFAGTGRYGDATPTGLPARRITPGTPILCCGIGLSLVFEDGQTITPKGVLQVVLQTGTVLAPLAPGGSDDTLIEQRVVDVVPSIQIVCETQTAFEWSRLLGKRCRVQYGFGSSPRWAVDAPEMMLQGLPALTALESGATGQTVIATAAGVRANSVLEISRTA